MRQLLRLMPAWGPLVRQVNQLGAITTANHTSSTVEAEKVASIGWLQSSLISPTCRLFSSGQSPPQDLGPANPVPEEISESHMSNSLTKQLIEAGDRGDLSAVLKMVETAGEQLDESAVESALLQVERCTEGMSPDAVKDKIHNTKTFQMLADMAVSGARKAAPEVLARTIGVFGRLGFADQMVLDELARSLMPGVQQLSPHQMHQLVQGLKSVDHSPGVLLLDAINERLAGLGADVEQQQAQDIRAGLKDLGHTGDNTVSSAQPQQQTERVKYMRGGDDRSA